MITLSRPVKDHFNTNHLIKNTYSCSTNSSLSSSRKSSFERESIQIVRQNSITTASTSEKSSKFQSSTSLPSSFETSLPRPSLSFDREEYINNFLRKKYCGEKIESTEHNYDEGNDYNVITTNNLTGIKSYYCISNTSINMNNNNNNNCSFYSSEENINTNNNNNNNDVEEDDSSKGINNPQTTTLISTASAAIYNNTAINTTTHTTSTTSPHRFQSTSSIDSNSSVPSQNVSKKVNLKSSRHSLNVQRSSKSFDNELSNDPTKSPEPPSSSKPRSSSIGFFQSFRNSFFSSSKANVKSSFKSFILSVTTPKSQNKTLSNAFLSSVPLLTFPCNIGFGENKSKSLNTDKKVKKKNFETRLNESEEEEGLPTCRISSPTPPIDSREDLSVLRRKHPSSDTINDSPKTKIKFHTHPANLPTLSSPSILHHLQPPTADKKMGFIQRKFLNGKKLSVAINPQMNRLMEGCQTVGILGKERHHSQKRESILHKSLLDMSPSIRSSSGSFNESHPEMIITPFAQLLSSLRNIRNNYFLIADISPKRSRRLSGYEIDKLSRHAHTNEEHRQRIALETLEEIEFCLDRLESMLSHPSASQLAAHKFRQIIKEEMSQDPDFNTRSSNSITSYLRSFLDEHSNEGRFTRHKHKGSRERMSKERSTKEGRIRDSSRKNTPDKNITYHRVKSSSIESLSRVPCPVFDSHTKNNLHIKEENNEDGSIKIITCTNSDYSFTSNGSMEDDCMDLESFKQPLKPDLQKLLDSTDNIWGVDLFELSRLTNHCLLTHVSMSLFKKRRLLSKFQISEEVFFNYWSKVERHYHPSNPYHNNVHATDVLQAAHYMLNFPSFDPPLKLAQSYQMKLIASWVIQGVFNDLEIFAALFAAGVHDVDHPGVNNLFLINTNSELAILYNDESVLENHHITLAFQLLRKSSKDPSNVDCDILANLDRWQRQQFRKMVIAMVLGTDMSKHLDHVARLKTMVEMRRLSSSSSSSSPHTSPAVNPENAEDKLHVLQSLIHCSDLSNPLKPLNLYMKWTEKIMEEFFRQGDRERQLQLEVSPLCDRNAVNICKSQMGFIDYVVYPLWESWALLCQPHCQGIIDILHQNRSWVANQANQTKDSPSTCSTCSDSDGSSTCSDMSREEKRS